MKVQTLVLLLATTYLSSSNAMKCDRVPEGTGSSKSPPDGRFRLRIINDPVRYIPGETYRISIEGVTRHISPSPQKFVGFFLTLDRERTSFSRYDEEDLGSFSIVNPALSKISEKCPNLVVNTNSVPKSDVLVEWTAPAPGKGCITFKSTIIEHRDIFFMDDGPLSKVLCEDEADSFDSEGIVQECTACDEAKYELTFEGLWSRNTHPKDFPDNGWSTKFSDVIGASHSIRSNFWRYGYESTPGMKELAEFGATALLEDELKEKGDNIRTIIKARGISYPNVNGKTHAVFRTDSNRHLVSVVSKLYPSPDWFVGVSDLELCLANGQWVESKVINLYPYDAGTDSGATYISPDQPTRPPESIRRIKPNMPNDPRSPFYDPENKEMKPLARLYITRQRLYEKTCRRSEDEEDDQSGYKTANRGYNHDEDETNYCETKEWSEWKRCNNSCGDGFEIRNRYYKNLIKATEKGCNEVLNETKPCIGNWNCKNSKGNARPDQDTRETQDKFDVCPNSECDDTETTARPLCPTEEWSDWTPCLATKGLGLRFHVRLPERTHLNSDLNLQRFQKIKQIIKNKSYIHKPDLDEILTLNVTTTADPNHNCFGVNFVESKICGKFDEKLDQDPKHFCKQLPPMQKCHEDPEVRYFYNHQLKRCGMFMYSGCNMTKNNFETYDLCNQICHAALFHEYNDEKEYKRNELEPGNLIQETIDCEMTPWEYTSCNTTCGDGYRWKYRKVLVQPQSSGKPCPRNVRKLEKCTTDCELVTRNQYLPYPQFHVYTTQRSSTPYCEYSEWSAWSPCSKSCGHSAVQIRTRALLNLENIAYCNERLEQRKCMLMPCLSQNYNYRQHTAYNSY